MTKEEAYNKMAEGYAVSHKDFGNNEFVFMDELYIIRDETGEEFEASWDVRSGDSWETDWFIFKNKKLIDKAKAATDVILDKVDTVTYIEGNTERELEYMDRIASEPIVNKITRAIGMDHDGDLLESFDTEDSDTITIEQNLYSKKIKRAKISIIMIIVMAIAIIGYSLLSFHGELMKAVISITALACTLSILLIWNSMRSYNDNNKVL